jgi:hypothetical protein
MTPKELVEQVHASVDEAIPDLGVSCYPSYVENGVFLLAANLTAGRCFKFNGLAVIHHHFKPGQEVAARNALLAMIHLGVTESELQRSKKRRYEARRDYSRIVFAERAAVN